MVRRSGWGGGPSKFVELHYNLQHSLAPSPVGTLCPWTGCHPGPRCTLRTKLKSLACAGPFSAPHSPALGGGGPRWGNSSATDSSWLSFSGKRCQPLQEQTPAPAVAGASETPSSELNIVVEGEGGVNLGVDGGELRRGREEAWRRREGGREEEDIKETGMM